MFNIEESIAKANMLGNHVWVEGPADPDLIDALEKKLGFALSPSYKQFLLNFGAISIGDSVITGIVDGDPLSEVVNSLYGATMSMREDFADQYEVPEHLWVLEPHEDGAFCFNSRIRRSDGELAVVNYEPYLPPSSFEEIIAGSFEEYLENDYFPVYLEEDENP